MSRAPRDSAHPEPHGGEGSRAGEAPGAFRGFSFALERDPAGRLSLRARHHPGYGAIVADWGVPEVRRRIAGGRRQLLARAIGLPKLPDAEVLDATGGLGRDGFTLAALGARVTLAERQPLVAQLLADAHRRALADLSQAAAAQRLEVVGADAVTLLAGSRRWDVIYLDPMYPHAGRTALASKEMQLLRELAGPDDDAAALLGPALANARRRVVVKRPAKAPPLGGREPSVRLEGTQARFDVHLVPESKL